MIFLTCLLKSTRLNSGIVLGVLRYESSGAWPLGQYTDRSFVEHYWKSAIH